MSNSPLVSVIIPIYNASDYLQRCLVSILNQSYKNIEIILINDGSTDNSVEICKKWEKDNNNIIFIDSLNKGVSEARNKGLEISKGDYICFIDSDDYIDKNYIKILLQTALYENADIVECNYKRVLENGNLIEKKDLKEYCKTNTYDIIHDFLYGLQFSNTVWNKIFKKDILNNVKFKPYATSEDFNFLAHVYLNVKKKVQGVCDRYDGDEKLGANVVLEALETPIRQILYNAGEDASVILSKINEMEEGMGYDALNLKFVNMKESGIIDPAKVTRNAILNAASIAGMVITTEAICVSDKNEEKMPQEIM